ncbi:hypothetical protein Tco_0804080 [Tanacetum coccineum]|uniref:MAK10-like protein n=1 Tax=Tanacetum coccineum TaxID=301880 RepID=A0ABQ5A4A4_9ASTR
MGDANPIRTLEDYSKPSHKGYWNTIELPKGNNVVPLRFDTIWLVQNGCSFHGLRSEDPNQHLKDFLKLVDSLDLDGANREITRLRLFIFSLRDQAHTERMERFENAISKQQEEINDRMAKMFGLLRELITSRVPKKVLIREEVKSPITKNVNSISLTRREEEKSNKDDVATGDGIEKTNAIRINEKLIERLVDNHRFNDSLSRVRVGKMKGKTYNLLPTRHVYEAILKKKITRKEDIVGNFEIPCNIGGKGCKVDVAGMAVIKFDKGTITLRFGKKKISFHRKPKSLGKDEKRIKNDIEPIAPTMTMNRLVLE